MKTERVRLTDSRALSLPAPATSYVIHWCADTPGFGLRVTANGARAWILERRFKGKTLRRTLGSVTGRGSITAHVARELFRKVNGELANGVDRLESQRVEIEAERTEEQQDALTLDVALRDYVERKRRGKDGLPLKERTRADYLKMIEPGKVTAEGRKLADGELFAIADTPIAKISADDIRRAYERTAKRSQRQAAYAMQVLRAVLNWHGVKVPGNPLSKDTAGRDRIVLPPTKGNPSPIPLERLGAWWASAQRAGKGKHQVGGSAEAGDACRFMLLTGCRPGEVFGNSTEEPLKVGAVDLAGAKLVRQDTKNRTDHTVYLSRQALAIAAKYVEGKKRGEPLFNVRDPGKTLQAIGEAAGVQGITAHKLRHTFASLAEDLVSAGALKRMLNHAATGDDVTQTHYVGKSEAQLRAAWQAVADCIESIQAEGSPAISAVGT